MTSNWKLPKWAVVIAAALIFLPLTIDWVQPGVGARLAELALHEVKVGGEQRMLFPLWSWLVGLAGKDVVALGCISVGAALVCVWLVAVIFGTIFGAAVRKAESQAIKGEGNYALFENVAVLVAGLGFALTPWFLAAATRISPLMVALVPPLAAVALVAWVVTDGAYGANPIPAGASVSVRFVERMKKGKLWLLLAAGLSGYSAYELILARRVFLALAFPAIWVWLTVGVMPALVIAWCVRKRWIGAVTPAADETKKPKDTRKTLWWSLAVWGAAVAVMGAVTFSSGKLGKGRVASRIVERIIANAVESGKRAVVSDGVLDELYFFMLPENMRLITLSRDRDPEYGRELAAWTRQTVKVKVEDLAFAAELGPLVLIDEWMKLDRADFESTVASAINFFPTREQWEDACGALKEMPAQDPLAKYLHNFLMRCGYVCGYRKSELPKAQPAAAKRELSPEVMSFIEKVVDAPKDPQQGKAAQAVMHEAIREGRIRPDAIGGRLIAIDLALGDLESAEKDAIDVLRINRHDPTANATLGSLAGSRGDYERAERYLKRAIETGKASFAAKNDYAWTLCKLGRLDEAEPYAREVVKLHGGVWTFRQTLAAILIRKGFIEEGERELDKAEELAVKAGIPKGTIDSIKADRTMLMQLRRNRK